nr:TPM domain-containing protein [Chloroflexota bacterium]
MTTIVGRAVLSARPRPVIRLLVAVLAVSLFAGVGTALAAAPRALRTAVDDETGRLAADRERILDAFQVVADGQDIELWTLWITSTDGMEITEFGERVAALTDLGDRDALLVVALNDRTDTVWIGPGLVDEISTAEQERIRTQQVEPRLARAEFGAAVIGFANGVAAAVPATPPSSGPTAIGTGPGATVRPTEPATTVPPAGGGGGGIGLPVLLGLILLAVVGFWAYGRIRRGRATVAQQTADEQLGREANALLIQTDDLVRDARQEIGFAEAQFGAEAVKPFQHLLDGAAAELKSAFQLGQELDDAVPEPPSRRQEMLKEIVSRCGKARQAVEQVRTSIEGLRDLEKSAPELLASLPGQLDAVEARIPAAEGTLQRLQAYADGTWQSVATNVAGARERLAAARTVLAEGQAALQATPPSMAQAALKARAAQLDGSQAQTLLDAIDKLAVSLGEMQRQLTAELGAASADVAAAQAALAAGTVSGMEPRLAEAQAALASAEQEARNERPDIVAALRQASNANQMADQILGGVREVAAQQERAIAMASSSVATADANVARVRDFIESRRGVYSIGRMARNRLVEAERRADLARSLLGTDVGRATLEAQNADRLADAAYQLALDDVDAVSPPSGGYVEPYAQGQVTNPTESLGGLLGILFGGGGGRGGGWGSGGWGGGSG